MNRIAYIDNLKWLMIIFVVMIHAAIIYGGVGRLEYKEIQQVDVITCYFYAFFASHTQAYFMALLFMISAYFIPSSLQKKGARKFIVDRIIRLGIPTLFYMLVINPVIRKLIHPENVALTFSGYQKYITSLDFLYGTGPMWFAVALLVFSIAYCMIDSVITKLTDKFSFTINVRNVAILIMVIASSAFLIRLVYPIGTAVLNFQLGNFAAYVVMFVIGIVAYKKDLLEKITLEQAKKWFMAAFLVGIPIWVILVTTIISSNGLIDAHKAELISGGWHWQAWLFTFWESYFGVTVIIGLTGIFKYYFNTQNALQKFLSANAFGVYVFHPLVLISLALLLKQLHIYPLLKFFLVASVAIVLSFILASLIRKISVARKIFS